MRVLRAEDLVDATWTGVQDVRAIVDVTHRDTGEHLGRAASAVAHDSGTTPTWGDRGRHGLIRVAVPASYPPESLRIIISLESQSYVAEHVDLGHAETDFFAPSPFAGWFSLSPTTSFLDAFLALTLLGSTVNLTASAAALDLR